MDCSFRTSFVFDPDTVIGYDGECVSDITGGI